MSESIMWHTLRPCSPFVSDCPSSSTFDLCSLCSGFCLVSKEIQVRLNFSIILSRKGFRVIVNIAVLVSKLVWPLTHASFLTSSDLVSGPKRLQIYRRWFQLGQVSALLRVCVLSLVPKGIRESSVLTSSRVGAL